MSVNVMDLMDYEDGQLGPNEVIDLFSELVKSGAINGLQGSYGRTAHSLIEAGYLDAEGDVLFYYGDGDGA